MWAGLRSNRKVKSGEILAKKVGRAYLVSDEEVARVLSGELSESDKKQINRAVKKVVEEYGEVLKRLGKD